VQLDLRRKRPDFIGNVEEDLLSITAVYPMREEAVLKPLKKADSGWRVVQKTMGRMALSPRWSRTERDSI